LAADTETGLLISKHLLSQKVEGQRTILEHHTPEARSAIAFLLRAKKGIQESDQARGPLALEAKAANLYWRSLSGTPVRFARVDLDKIPDHWSKLGERHSPLSSKPKLGIAPGQVVANYLYRLAEFECRLGLIAIGLDPGLGWAHRDAPYRDSAALDVLEAIRPAVDDYLLKLLSERTFSRKEFLELATGQVRLASRLAKLLAESSFPLFERAVGPIVEEVARILAGSASSPVTVRTRLTQADRRRGRAGNKGARNSNTIPNACRVCGVILSIDERGHVRKICDDCLPAFEVRRTEKLVRSAKRTLAEMRSSGEDPAQTAEAKAKRARSLAERTRLAKEWEQANPGHHDRREFTRRILPRLENVTLPAMVKATGLTSGYCLQIKRGTRTPHPMYWSALHSLTQTHRSGDTDSAFS
jgi:hypothetical protein